MLTIEEARTRVTRGAAHLDVVRPGWHDRIDFGKLAMESTCDCIVGQVCGSYWLRHELGIDTNNAVAFGVALNLMVVGISHDALVQEWRPIQDAWIEAIADRKLAASAKLIETTHPAPVPVQA